MKTHARQIADPYRAQYPRDDLADCSARSIHDMQIFRDRIYLGAGDYWNNRGPIDVWSFRADLEPLDLRIEIEKEDFKDHAVEYLTVSNETLFIPGADTVSGSNGNFYYNQSVNPDAWVENIAKIPNANHVGSVVWFGGEIIVAFSRPVPGQVPPNEIVWVKSSDMGETWEPLLPDQYANSAGRPVVTEKGLIIIGEQSVFRYDGSDVEAFFYPHYFEAPYRHPLVFDDQVVFSSSKTPYAFLSLRWGVWENNWPLFALEDLGDGPKRVISLPADTSACVSDLVVSQRCCYLLRVLRRTGNSEYLAEVDASHNLKDWKVVARFSVPAMPYSLEVSDDKQIFVGLGQLRVLGFAERPPEWQMAPEPHSGTVWTID